MVDGVVSERTVKERAASFGGLPYGALPLPLGLPLRRWPVIPRPVLMSPLAARFYPFFGAPFASKTVRKYRLEALKGLARHFDQVLNDLWEEIVELEEKDHQID
jgi:hypothetical protein